MVDEYLAGIMAKKDFGNMDAHRSRDEQIALLIRNRISEFEQARSISDEPHLAQLIIQGLREALALVDPNPNR